MASCVNSIVLIGHIGAKPEKKDGDCSIATFSLATNRKVKRGEDYIEQTDWHRVVCFGNTADFVANYTDKGSLLSVEGRLQTRTYEQDGQTRYITEIVAHRVNQFTKPSPSAPSDKPSNKKISDTLDDDIPF